jgi:hypothetical protein
MTKIEDCIARYGPVQTAPEGGLVWREAPNWVKPLTVPDKIVMRNYLGKPVYRIYCNTDIHEPLTAAFSALITCGAHVELETFDGCYAVRWVRGMPGVLSFHSFAIAIDFNAKQNPLGAAGKWSDDFLRSFEEAGFTNGGKFNRRDFMHFELREIPNGRSDTTV